MSPLWTVQWVGTSLKELQGMPEPVRDEMGFVLGRVQEGKWHTSIRSLIGITGVWEIRSNHASDTYRLVFATSLSDAIYVLHVFQKKSRRGISTPKYELDVIRARLKRAKEIADERAR